MAVVGDALRLAQVQQRRFSHLRMTAIEGHRDMALGGLDDWKRQTSEGAGPQGHARVKWLRDAGHPFARGAAPGTGGGLKRGILKSRRKKAGMASVPNAPVGRISGRLNRSIQMRRSFGGTQSFDVGTTSSAGRSAWVLKPGGTQKMVFRPIYDTVNRNWRARNYAFMSHFVRKQRTP